MTSSATRRSVVLLAGIIVLSVQLDAADRQIRPFIGATVGGATTFVDPENAIGTTNLSFGVSAMFLGEVFGTEIDVADAPNFFQSGDKNLVHASRVTTIIGNVVVAAPHRLTEYAVRPYVVGGAGLMRVRTTTTFSVFDVSAVIPAVDVGVGAVAFLTNKVGASLDVRRLQSVGSRTGDSGLSFGDEHLSFWRASMAVAIRY